MVHYFFINPAAGQGKGIDKLAAEIETAAEELNIDYEIYLTGGICDGERQASRFAEIQNGTPARFYACGGDGTLNEIINGAAAYSNIEVGCVPIGTGNDMVRNFPGRNFLDIKKQIRGNSEEIDLMRYRVVAGGKRQTRYCANMFNIGFDCNVVELAGRLKKKPLISGSAAYLLAVLGMFIKKKTISLYLTEGEEVLVDGEVLLCAVANGSYCGGGLKTSPQSDVQDGVFDLNVIRDVTRREFLKLFPVYMKGAHLGAPGIEDVITVKRCTGLKLQSKKKSFFLCADGEITAVQSAEFEMAPKAVRFILPAAEL